MEMQRLTGILLMIILLPGVAMAQKRKKASTPPAGSARPDTTIKSTTLEVYQVYQPELKPIAKPELSPTLPPPPAERPAQQYDVPQQTLYYSYRALPLRPLALGKDSAILPPANYALLGGGNLSTILGELGIGSLRGRNWYSALTGRYVTQEGPIEGQVFRNLSVQGNAAMETNRHLWDAGLRIGHDVHGLYGYNHDILKYGSDMTRLKYTGVGVSAGVTNTTPTAWGLTYQPRVAVSVFSGTALNNETSIRISLPVSKQIDSSLRVEFGVHADIASASYDSGSISNNIIQFTPGISYARQNVWGHAGLYPTVGKDATYLLPDLQINYKVIESGLIVHAGWTSRLIANTFEQLIGANPFYTRLIEPVQAKSDEVFGGISIALLKHLSLTGSIGWQQYANLPLFVTQPVGDGKDFTVLYDPKVQAIVFKAGIRYAIGEDISLGGAGTWYSYNKHTYNRVWGEPAVRLKGDASWKALTGLTVSAYLEVLDQIYGRDALGNEIKQKGVFEVGAAGEYSIVQKLSVWLRAENLLGRKNERWLGYPSFGFNIYGGLRLRF